MRHGYNLALYWRLLASYALVILVSCVTLYLVGDLFASYFFSRYLAGMMRQMQHMSPMMEAMAADLNSAYRQVTQWSMIWGLGAAAVVASIVGLFVTRRIVAPVKSMQRASRRIASGQYRERLDAQAPGEIGELAESFNEMAEALERTEARRVELLANVAHEFKTPLSGLRGYVAGLQDGLFEADEETLEACAKQIERLERLVADLSLLSRVEAGEVPVRARPLGVTELLEQATAALRPAFATKEVALCLRSKRQDLRVRADPERTGQVLANLLDNALKHTPSGGRVDLSATLTAADEARFEVVDTGVGISREDLPHLFTRFYRADKSRKRLPESGSGIGLTIAKHYVERQGGRIGVTSDPGKGSLFWFTLPTYVDG
jgi:signal transduction histidine kinase